MKYNFSHIIEGWSKSMGLMDVTEENKKLSVDRLKICGDCPSAVESSFLKILRGNADQIKAIKCGVCGCPVNEKTLVTDEKCPFKKW